MTSAAFENIISRDKREQFIGLRNTAFVLLVCLVALYVTGFFDAQRFIEGAPAVKQLSSEMVPPNFDRWEHWVIPLRDTLAMSIAGTALTIVLSLPLALLAAPNTTPNPLVGRVARVILADRKSTRLNSSHLVISYAVFCLKKKQLVHIVDPPPEQVGDAVQPPMLDAARVQRRCHLPAG